MMDKNGKIYSAGTLFSVRSLVAVFIVLCVSALSLGDLIEITPALASLASSPAFAFFHNVHDLLAVSATLFVAYKMSVRIGAIGISLFLAAHIPYVLVSFRQDTPEILRIFFVAFTALFGVWLIDRLRSLEERYHTLVEDIPVGVSVSDAAGRMTDANRTLVRMFGYDSKEELRGSSPFQRCCGVEDRGRWTRLMDDNGRVEGFEAAFKRRDGSSFWSSLSSVPHSGEFGERQFLSVIQDITVRKHAEEALRQSEERFRRLADATLEGIVITENGAILDANETMAAMLRCPLSAMIGKKSVDFVAPPFRDLVARRIASAYEQVYEAELLRTDGTIFPVEARGKMTSYGGRTVRIVAIKDISELRSAAELLRRSAEEYQGLVDNIKLGIFRSTPGPAGRFLTVNKAMEDITGYSREELLRMDVSSLYVHPEERESVIKGIADNAGKVRKELHFRKKDGREIIVADTKTPVLDDTGKLVYFDGVLEDITELMKIENELRVSARLLDSASDFITLLDSNLKLRYVNQAFCQAHGYSREELIGKDMRELDHRRLAGVTDPSTAMAGGERTFKTVHVRRDGSEFPIEVHSRVLYLGDEMFRLNIERDITERTQMEEKLMTQDRLASIGQLVSGVAHELNNPLTSVVGFSDLLLEKDISDDISRDVKIISAEALRASAIVKNLLTFARQQPQGKMSIDINEPIRRVLELRGYELKVNRIQLETDLAPDLPKVMGNSSQLQQVFFNIVINAEFFMAQYHGQGALKISTRKSGSFVRVSITDDGPGISPQNMRRLFGPFFTTKDVGKGTGLGLSISQGIVAEHGGRIWAESEPSRGATFFVELPQYEGDAS